MRKKPAASPGMAGLLVVAALLIETDGATPFPAVRWLNNSGRKDSGGPIMRHEPIVIDAETLKC